MMRRIWLVLMVLVGNVLLGGCALSRSDHLARQSDRVESRLLDERDRVMRSVATMPDAGERLHHLRGLHTQLTFADTARKLAPRLLQDPAQVDAAYDILEEVYSTIEWNIPLSPRDSGQRTMPSLFGPDGLDFSTLQSPAR